LEISVNVRAARAVAIAGDLLIAEYSNCAAVFNVLMAPVNEPCRITSQNLIHVRRGMALNAIALIIFMFQIGAGAKRFIPLTFAEEYLETEEEEKARLEREKQQHAAAPETDDGV